MKRYAPALVFEMVFATRKAGAWYDATDSIIRWPIGDGLSVLMHEIGHYKLNHWRECCRERLLWEEVTAWLWAENECKKLGILFDYILAEHYFHLKKWNKKHRMVKINWRHRNE